MIIYKITNLINSKIYIGQTIQTLNKRMNRHFSDADRGKKTTPLYLAIKKYGKINFKVDIIDNATSIDELNEKEIYWIKHYNSIDREIGYNMTHGGDRALLLPEVRKRIADKKRGQKHSDETKKKMSKAHKGKNYRKWTEEQKIEYSIKFKKLYKEGKIKGPPNNPNYGSDHHMYGKTHTDEAKAKISKSRKGKRYEEVMDAETSKRLKELRRRKWIEKSPTYVDITKEQLEEQYLLDISIEEVAINLKISRPTVFSKTKKYWNKTPAIVKQELLDAKNRNS